MNLSRRDFCSAIVAAGLGAASLPLNALPASGAEGKTNHKPSQPLRVIAYNIYGGRFWPEKRRRAKLAVADKQVARRIAMELALYQPDIVNFSESSREGLTKAIAADLGMKSVFFPSGEYYPGTLLSQFDIAEHENVPLGYERPKNLFTRHWGRGVISLPSGESLVVHSAHLFPGRDPSTRLKEIKAMLEAMKPDLDAGRSMLLMGDLNHRPDTDEYKLWIDAGWVDTFAKVGEGDGFTVNADVPKRRIDYVFATGPIAARVTESRPLFEGAFRLNLADDTAFALSDHLPQFAQFGES